MSKLRKKSSRFGLCNLLKRKRVVIKPQDANTHPFSAPYVPKIGMYGNELSTCRRAKVTPASASQAQPAATPAAAPSPKPLPPASWYPDPAGQARLRYWDGAGWTEHTAE